MASTSKYRLCPKCIRKKVYLTHRLHEGDVWVCSTAGCDFYAWPDSPEEGQLEWADGEGRGLLLSLKELTKQADRIHEIMPRLGKVDQDSFGMLMMRSAWNELAPMWNEMIDQLHAKGYLGDDDIPHRMEQV